MRFDEIIIIIIGSAIVLLSLGLFLFAVSKDKYLKINAVSKIILILGSIPSGIIGGGYLIVTLSDTGLLGSSFRGEGKLIPVLLFSFVGAFLAPIMVKKLINKW